jgi:hypothetical protein
MAEVLEILDKKLLRERDSKIYRNKGLKKLVGLYDHLVNNKAGLIPYKLRGIDMPTPPDGIEYRQLGTMEHNICDVLAMRMKEIKMSWSINGAVNLGKILSEKFSNRLFSTIDKIYKNIIPNDVIDTIVNMMPLTASDVNKKRKESKYLTRKKVR